MLVAVNRTLFGRLIGGRSGCSITKGVLGLGASARRSSDSNDMRWSGGILRMFGFMVEVSCFSSCHRQFRVSEGSRSLRTLLYTNDECHHIDMTRGVEPPKKLDLQ